jgi:hypothetical protein
MSEVPNWSQESVPLELAREIDRICDTFVAELTAGHEPRIESYLGQIATEGRAALLRELIVAELEFRIAQGRPSVTESYHARFPDDRATVDDALALINRARTQPVSSRREAVQNRATNHNLLFGIIALQSDFLTREQLVAGFDVWVHDKSRAV